VTVRLRVVHSLPSAIRLGECSGVPSDAIWSCAERRSEQAPRDPKAWMATSRLHTRFMGASSRIRMAAIGAHHVSAETFSLQ
jgi:hypothetical protein